MIARPPLLAAALAVAVGCRSPTTGPDDSDPGPSAGASVTVEGTTTTVVNRDLGVTVEELTEEVAIGAADGDEAYLLGGVSAIAASPERIYIADFQTVSVRAYDGTGNHLFDFGGEGAGPGEFRRPWALGVDPAGRLVVRDQLQRRVHVFDAGGELVADWPSERGIRSTVGSDGSVYVMREDIFPNADGRVTAEVMDYAPDGTPGAWRAFPDHEPTPAADYPVDDPTGPPPEMRGRIELMAVFLGVGADWRSTRWVPFAPRVVVEVAPDGSLVSGRAHEYRFRVQRPDGTELVVEKEWTPVAVHDDEADWHRRRLTALWRAATNEGWAWLGGPIPSHKGAYRTIIPARDGSFWVVREVAGERVEGCDESPEDFYAFDAAPCWRQPYVADVFDASGTLVRTFRMPDGIQYYVRPYVTEDALLAVTEDAAGVARVRRYAIDAPS